jgi:CheY-like chemotaxis protein
MKILLVDDDPVSLRILKEIVSAEPGHETTEATGGEQAWKLLNNPALFFDIVFLDVSMPETDGLQVLDRIRESQILRSLRIVMCTATSDRETVDKVIKRGIRHFIVKPATAPLVHAKLRQLQAEIAADAAPRTKRRSAE